MPVEGCSADLGIGNNYTFKSLFIEEFTAVQMRPFPDWLIASVIVKIFISKIHKSVNLSFIWNTGKVDQITGWAAEIITTVKQKCKASFLPTIGANALRFI